MQVPLRCMLLLMLLLVVAAESGNSTSSSISSNNKNSDTVTNSSNITNNTSSGNITNIANSRGRSRLGVNWGTVASHQLPVRTVVDMLRANGIHRVKLFDADDRILDGFAGTSIELMIGIPNFMLEEIASSRSAAALWVERNVTSYLAKRVNIRYIAVGNEPFLQAYQGSFQAVTYPALKNIVDALGEAKLSDRIKATVPLNGDVLSNGDSNFPSTGSFREDVASEVVDIVKLLNASGSPFTINSYPFLSLQQDPNFPFDFAFFDGAKTTKLFDPATNVTYNNVFDASHDLLVAALGRAGYPDIEIIIGEVGWPTDGHPLATPALSNRFVQSLAQHVTGGTPLRRHPIRAYLFSLLDEDLKSTIPGSFERHWGIFAYDGKAKFELDLAMLSTTSIIIAAAASVNGSGAPVNGTTPSAKGAIQPVNGSTSLVNGTTPPVNGPGKAFTAPVNGSAGLVNAKRVRYLPRKWCVLDPRYDVTDPNTAALVGRNVDFACSNADCTSLVFGSSCNGAAFVATAANNASYAFNSYYQLHDQVNGSCYFDGLASISIHNPSAASCRFKVQLDTRNASSTTSSSSSSSSPNPSTPTTAAAPLVSSSPPSATASLLLLLLLAPLGARLF